jgi:hypothetical protein
MPKSNRQEDEKELLLATQLSFMACIKTIQELNARMSRLETRVATLAAKMNSNASTGPRRRRAVKTA